MALKAFFAVALIVGLMPSVPLSDGTAYADSGARAYSADLEAPTLESISASPSVAGPGDTVTVTAKVSDPSGVSGGLLVGYARQSGESDSVVLHKAGDGTYSGTIRVLDGTEPGQWRAKYVCASDAVGNTGYTFSKDFASSAFGDYVLADLSAGDFTVTDGSEPSPDPIQKTVIQTPSGKALSYNGEEQTGVEAGEGYTVTGGSATEPGSYVATVSLTDKENCIWSLTGSSDDIQVNWSISEPDYTWSVDDGAHTMQIELDSIANVSWSLSNPVVATLGNMSSSKVSFGSYQHQVASVDVTPVQAGFTDLYAYAGGQLVSKTSIRITPSTKVDLSQASIGGVDDVYKYTGSAVAPKPVVTLGGLALMEGVDYTLSYSNNTQPGKATVTVTGIGGYKGQASRQFSIKKEIFSPGSREYTYGGNEIAGYYDTEGYRVKSGGAATNVGTYTAVFTLKDPELYMWGDGSTDDKSVEWTIAPCSVSGAEIGGLEDAYAYTGSAITPKPVVKVDGRTLAEGVDYTLSYSDNVEPGKGVVTVKGMGNYKDQAQDAFSIAAPVAPPDPDPVDPAPTPDPVDPEPGAFPDVDESAWYSECVTLAAQLGYMKGYPDGTFGPDLGLNRAEAACTLLNMAKGSDENTDSGFPDVASSDWFAGSVTWARSAGVMGGYQDGTFGPYDPLTREQVACTLYNYAKSIDGADVSVSDGSILALSLYADADDIDDWAVEAVAWAVEHGVMGNGDLLNPRGPITRAEMAAMTTNYQPTARS